MPNEALVFEKVSCDFCGQNTFENILTGTDWEFGRSEEFNVVKCSKCGLVQQNPRPDSISIKYIYPKNYGCYSDAHITRTLTGRIKLIIKKLLKRGRIYPYLDNISKGKILDVGCSTGHSVYPFGWSGSLMDLVSKRWQAYGCEMEEEAARLGEQSGLDIKIGKFDAVDFEEDNFDVVRFNHVLEHAVSPKRDLQKAVRVLRQDGLVIITVPNFESAAYYLFKNFWSGLDLPRHFYFFTPQTLKNYFNSLNLELISEYYDSIPDDFVHSIKHFLHSELFETAKIRCTQNDRIGELYGANIRKLQRSLRPIIDFFNKSRLGDSYTTVCQKKS